MFIIRVLDQSSLRGVAVAISHPSLRGLVQAVAISKRRKRL